MKYRISGVHVFDGFDMQPGTRDVDVDGSRIVATRKEASEHVIDFSHVPDATVLPGLIDAHLHFAIGGADQAEKANHAALVALRMAHSAHVNLRAGITTVRDMGAKEHIDVRFKEAVALGFVPSPRYLVAGKPIIATGGHCTYMGRQVDGPAEARKATREQLTAGVDWVKMMVTGGIMTRGTDPRTQQLFDDEIAAVVETAHAAGKPVAVHCQGGPAVVATIKAGVDSLEHGMWLDDEAIELMLKNDTAYVPTLSAFYLIAEGEAIEGVAPPEWAVEKSRIATEAHRSSFGRAVEAGVRIVAGTDYKHGSLPFELSLMADWGMSNVDVLRSATSRSADMLRLPNVGRISEGAEADLIVVAGDPTRDIRALSDVEFVVQGGKIVFDKRTFGAHVSFQQQEVVR